MARFQIFSWLVISGLVVTCYADNWPQASGPNGNFQASKGLAPTEWSVVSDDKVRWRTTLPEGGQSAVSVWGNRAFLTTHRPMGRLSNRNEPNIVGYCLDADTGEILWTVDLPGTDPVQTAGVFSDATVFAPITDGTHVWFFNRCGSMGCFDFSGKQVWLREFKPRPRHTNRECEPMLVGDLILTVEVRNKQAGQKLKRHKPIPKNIDPRDVWTYLHAINKNTGDVVWVGETGTSVHNSPMVGQLEDGRWAIVHGRGGGHQPLEQPYGVSLSLVETGETLWSREINGWCAFNSVWDKKHVYWFEKDKHHVLDVSSGEILRSTSLDKQVDFVGAFDPETRSRPKPMVVDLELGKRLPLTYHTNIVVGDWHYFLGHSLAVLGRVNTKSGRVEYLQLPAMMLASDSSRGLNSWVWEKKDLPPISTKNSRGVDIALDKRSRGSGWGHVSAASPILVGQYLYFPMLSGTTYVIDTKAETFTGEALIAVNDLGPAYETWSLSSLSYANSRLYARTMKEVICLE